MKNTESGETIPNDMESIQIAPMHSQNIELMHFSNFSIFDEIHQIRKIVSFNFFAFLAYFAKFDNSTTDRKLSTSSRRIGRLRRYLAQPQHATPNYAVVMSFD